jgi:hypothetical protein
MEEVCGSLIVLVSAYCAKARASYVQYCTKYDERLFSVEEVGRQIFVGWVSVFMICVYHMSRVELALSNN